MISDRSIGIRKTIHDVCTVVQDMLKEVKNTVVVQIPVVFCRETRQCAARIRLLRLINAQKRGALRVPYLFIVV
jgi:hypothetical protein